MKITAKYSVLSYDGKKGFIKDTYECPDFKDIENSLEIQGKVHKSIYTAIQQADEWLSDIDKADFMEDNDIHMIFDWSIISAIKEDTQLIPSKVKISKKEGVYLWLTHLSGFGEDFQNEFRAVYTKLYPKIKNLKLDKQISMTLSGIDLACTAAEWLIKV